MPLLLLPMSTSINFGQSFRSSPRRWVWQGSCQAEIKRSVEQQGRYEDFEARGVSLGLGHTSKQAAWMMILSPVCRYVGATTIEKQLVWNMCKSHYIMILYIVVGSSDQIQNYVRRDRHH